MTIAVHVIAQTQLVRPLSLRIGIVLHPFQQKAREDMARQRSDRETVLDGGKEKFSVEGGGNLDHFALGIHCEGKRKQK